MNSFYFIFFFIPSCTISRSLFLLIFFFYLLLFLFYIYISCPLSLSLTLLHEIFFSSFPCPSVSIFYNFFSSSLLTHSLSLDCCIFFWTLVRPPTTIMWTGLMLLFCCSRSFKSCSSYCVLIHSMKYQSSSSLFLSPISSIIIIIGFLTVCLHRQMVKSLKFNRDSLF